MGREACHKCFAKKDTEAYYKEHVQVCRSCRFKLNDVVNFLAFYGIEVVPGAMAETPPIPPTQVNSETGEILGESETTLLDAFTNAPDNEQNGRRGARKAKTKA